MPNCGLFVGLSTIDIQYFTNCFPEANIKIKTATPDILVGGPAANASVAYAFLGGNANFYTSIGNNSFQNHIINELETVHVVCTDMCYNEKCMPVIASVITTDNGDRTIFTHNPDKVEIEISAKDIFEKLQPQFLFIDGFYPEITIDFVKEAKTRQIPVIFDGGSWKQTAEPLFPFIDIAICSANFCPPQCHSSNDIFDFWEEKGVLASVITRGDQRIIGRIGESPLEIEIEKIKAVDTLGAGDFFHGAFCYYYSVDRNILWALKKAAILATETCKYKGTRSWLIKLKKEVFL